MVDLYAGEGTAAHAEEQRWQELQESLRARLQALCARGAGLRRRRPRAVAGGPRRARPARRGDPRGGARASAPTPIVMGSHGHTAVGELLLGSTAHRVAQRSTVPVLLVRVAEADTESGI